MNAFADDKLNVTQGIQVVFHWIETIETIQMSTHSIGFIEK